MAHIYRKTFTKVDPRTGEKVTRKRKKWRVRHRDADGIIQDVPGFRDREATKQLASDLEKMVARQKVGIIDRFHLHRQRPLAEHLGDFEVHLLAKGNTGKHVTLKITRIRAALDGCGFRMINDLVPSRVETWLQERREAGLSIQTSNHYLTCVKGFTRWLVQERRMPDDPLIGLKGLNVKLDPRHERRTLSQEDLVKFLDAARAGKPFRGISGPDRRLLYMVALYTGLRCSELASLTPESFSLDVDPPTVTVQAGYSKRRSEDVLVLRSDLAADLKTWLRWKPKGESLWPGTWKEKASRMVKRGLEAAGIGYKTEAGVFDFHAIRHQFISSLAASGVHPKVAQELARHSDINLTMTRYSHLSKLDEKKAVESLPPISSENDEEPRELSA